MHTRRRRIAVTLWLSLSLVALAGCAVDSPSSKEEPKARLGPSLESDQNGSDTTTVPAYESAPTLETENSQSSSIQQTVLEGDDLSELEPMLAGIDEAQAELDQFLNETASVMEAGEGEFTP